MDNIRRLLHKNLAEVCAKLFPELNVETQIVIDVPSQSVFGDYSCNLSLLIAGKITSQKLSPQAVAKLITEEFASRNYAHLSKVSVAGPGFINFTLSTQFLLSKLEGMSKDPYWGLEKNSGQTVLIEYSSPNIAKPFTVGHLRSTIIGEALANLFRIKGYDVKTDNHLGDWGTQFGKLIYAILAWGDLDQISKSDRPVKMLVDLYVRFHEEAKTNERIEDEARGWFTKLEKGDAKAKEIWQKCIDWSWTEFEAIYKKLGCRPFSENGGRGYGESYFESRMAQVVGELETNGLLQTGEKGAKIVRFENDVLPPLMILKQDGSTLYATRDLATDKFRLQKYGKDVIIINEVGNEQSLYFKQLFKLEEKLGWFAPHQRKHVGHGFFRLKLGKMSTRSGNAVWLEDVISQAIERAKKIGTKSQSVQTATQIGVGAIKWNDLKRSAHLDVVFDWDEILNMQGNCGPYIQYAAVRCKSVLAKAPSTPQVDFTKLSLNQEERQLLVILDRFTHTLDQCVNELAPHHLSGYLYDLASTFNSFYHAHQVLATDTNSRALRLLLTTTTLAILTQGLEILGIQIPKEM